MSAPATRRKRITQFDPHVSEPGFVRKEQGTVGLQRGESSQQRIPLGILHVNREWNVIEYRDRYEEYRDRYEEEDDLRPVNALGKNLFAIAPWIGHPEFVEALTMAIKSGTATSHFDFKVRVSLKSAERAIHVNAFVLGDTTAWLFISDQSLPV